MCFTNTNNGTSIDEMGRNAVAGRLVDMGKDQVVLRHLKYFLNQDQGTM